ncbi:MAG: cryptochrome/photolyase family protein [Pseudomonadales bacterium]|nr:cryptochrome/photolyase family protein [Pseudomonadales bacterium]
MSCERLVLLLGDQIGDRISALDDADPATTRVLLCEVGEEVAYARHHAKKLVFLFSAMRHRAERLRESGFAVDYVTLDDPDNSGSLTGELQRAVDRHAPASVHVTRPGEWRVQEALEAWADARDRALVWHEDDRFLASTADFERWAQGRKSLRMEYFYREMRRRHGLLMDGDDPAGGQWNFDADNRKALPRGADRPEINAPMQFRPDAITKDVIALVKAHCADAFGDPEPFWFAVTPGDARRAFTHFVKTRLARYGDYQDAMTEEDDFVFHALISIYLNVGLLDPLACCQAAEAAWREGKAPLNAVEGFIRQILGWREFIRGIYWHAMPAYAERNALGAELPLPEFYWTAKTGMNCLRRTVEATRRNAYAHHIQRLMVTGNFALLAGIRPMEVADWYLGVYADAYEWVELPNVLGMALFADGGLFASKPYAASGRYIQRMSDYCAGCRYRPDRPVGKDACPFNYLYWDFVARNEDRLRRNPRMAMVYRTLERMDPDRVATMREQAAAARADLDAL